VERRAARAIAAKCALAYLLLSTFWADEVGVEPVRGALWDAAHGALGAPDYWRDYVLVSVVGGVLLPLVLTRTIGPRTLDALGVRAPSRAALAVLAALYVALLPLVGVMSLHPAFRAGLDEALHRSRWFALAVPVGMGAEHFFFHGVLLAWLHPSGAFPPASELDRPLIWPGERLEDGTRASVAASIASLAIPRSCLVPCLLSGPLFWAIHVGKPDPELWLSLPAGVIFAWLAYRTNGFVVPLVLHASLPATAALIALATSA
jgi:hypothetical protein